MKDRLWLSISLFCNRCNWHMLLKQAIGNYISTLTNEKLLMNYRIELNYYRGENIRLALLIKEEFAAKVAKSADEYFKLFFKQADFPVQSSPLNTNSLFMPFAMNTIQYGLYKVDLKRSEILIELDQTISELLVEVLGDDIIDDDDLLTFAYYLHVALLKCPLWSDAEKNNNLKQLSNYNKSIADDPILWEHLEKKYSENKCFLDEIYAEIIATEIHLEWLRNWAMVCKKSLLKLDGKKYLDTIPYSKYQYFMIAINGILGINVSMQQILSYFLINSNRPQISINQSLLD